MMTAIKIIQTVAEVYRVSPKAILSKLKLRDVAEARQMCMYILRFYLNMSYSEIGQIFDRRQNTVSHGVHNIATMIKIDKEVKRKYEEIKRELPQYIEHEYAVKMRCYARQAKHEMLDEILDKL